MTAPYTRRFRPEKSNDYDGESIGVTQMTQIETLRTFASSAEARAAGFSTLQWLRAFTFSEHASRIEASRAITEREMMAWDDEADDLEPELPR